MRRVAAILRHMHHSIVSLIPSHPSSPQPSDFESLEGFDELTIAGGRKW